MQELFGAFIGSLILGIFVTLCTRVYIFAQWGYQNIEEATSPTSEWLVYSGIASIKDSFNSGEQLVFNTKVTRLKGLDTRREDTLRCYNGNRYETLQTQYRPVTGYVYKDVGIYNGDWRYYYPTPTRTNECKMCGNIISITPLGYRKVHTYCTDIFKVNQ